MILWKTCGDDQTAKEVWRNYKPSKYQPAPIFLNFWTNVTIFVLHFWKICSLNLLLLWLKELLLHKRSVKINEYHGMKHGLSLSAIFISYMSIKIKCCNAELIIKIKKLHHCGNVPDELEVCFIVIIYHISSSSFFFFFLQFISLPFVHDTGL